MKQRCWKEGSTFAELVDSASRFLNPDPYLTQSRSADLDLGPASVNLIDSEIIDLGVHLIHGRLLLDLKLEGEPRHPPGVIPELIRICPTPFFPTSYDSSHQESFLQGRPRATPRVWYTETQSGVYWKHQPLSSSSVHPSLYESSLMANSFRLF